MKVRNFIFNVNIRTEDIDGNIIPVDKIVKEIIDNISKQWNVESFNMKETNETN